MTLLLDVEPGSGLEGEPVGGSVRKRNGGKIIGSAFLDGRSVVSDGDNGTGAGVGEEAGLLVGVSVDDDTGAGVGCPRSDVMKGYSVLTVSKAAFWSISRVS